MNKWRFIDAWPVILLEFLTFLDLFFERNSCSYDHGITLSDRSSLRLKWNAKRKDTHFGSRFWSWVGAIFPLFLLCVMVHKEGVVYVNVDAQRGGGICKRWQNHGMELGMKGKVIFSGRFLYLDVDGLRVYITDYTQWRWALKRFINGGKHW